MLKIKTFTFLISYFSFEKKYHGLSSFTQEFMGKWAKLLFFLSCGTSV